MYHICGLTICHVFTAEYLLICTAVLIPPKSTCQNVIARANVIGKNKY